MPVYKRPPITEAVIEVRTDSDGSREVLEKVQRRFLGEYPFSTETKSLNVDLGGAAPKIAEHSQGYRLASKDGTELVSLLPRSIATSRLPPYEGWEGLIKRAHRNWATWRKVVGFGKPTRIGIRYVNRIDIPNREERPIVIGDYLTFRPEVPSIGLQAMDNFVLSGSMPFGKDNFRVTLITGTVPSPLLKTTSFVLDIDVFRTDALPVNEDTLWEAIDGVREHKNLLFEGCITDRARELFS